MDFNEKNDIAAYVRDRTIITEHGALWATRLATLPKMTRPMPDKP
jgi:hypothetical protein